MGLVYDAAPDAWRKAFGVLILEQKSTTLLALVFASGLSALAEWRLVLATEPHKHTRFCWHASFCRSPSAAASFGQLITMQVAELVAAVASINRRDMIVVQRDLEPRRNRMQLTRGRLMLCGAATTFLILRPIAISVTSPKS